jgi:Coenzyme PQQ synthesis protein D (PqqD)
MKVEQNLFVNYRVINKSAFVVNKGEAFKFEGIGQEIWELIGEEQDLKTIIDKLQSKYNVDRSVIENDTIAFLDSLLEKGLVEKQE